MINLSIMPFRKLFLLILISLSVILSDIALARENSTPAKLLSQLSISLSNHEKEASRFNRDLTALSARFKTTAKPDEAMQEEIAKLEKAKEWLSQINDSIKETRSFANAMATGDKLINEIQKKLQKPSEATPAQQLQKLSLDELNTLSNKTNLDLETERHRRADLENEISHLMDRREKISAEANKFQERQNTLKQNTPTATAESGKEPGSATLIAGIELLLTSQKLLEIEWEQRSYDIRRDILRSQRQLAEMNVLNYENSAIQLQSALNLARSKAAAESMTTAAIASKILGGAHPVIQEILKTNQDLASESAEVSSKITELTTEKQSLEQSLEFFRQSFNSIKDKISSAGLSDTIGLRLRNAKNQLPDLSSFARRMESRRSEIEQVQLRRIELEDRLLELVNINREVDKQIAKTNFTNEIEKKEFAEQLTQVLNEQKQKFLPATLTSYDNYFDNTLLPLLEKEKEYVKLINDYATYINERILWVKSSPFFSFQDIVHSLKSLLWLSSPSGWATVVKNILTSTSNNIIGTVSIMLLFVSTFFLRHKLVERLKKYGRYKTKLSLAKLSDSIKTGIATQLLAAY
ncbi:MAG: hypothetical protein R3240_03760 [Gammaproteobacteria bacterium]|nr:hypothetical protein [Gammaproteobacteria bacterium]